MPPTEAPAVIVPPPISCSRVTGKQEVIRLLPACRLQGHGAVFDAFLEEPKDWRYGYDISRDTGLKSGTLYPILMRLADHGLLETCWETTEAGKPPRHMYRLTRDGLRSAREQVRSYAMRRLQRADFGEVES